MREIRLSGSEGGAEQTNAPFLPLSAGLFDADFLPLCPAAGIDGDGDAAFGDHLADDLGVVATGTAAVEDDRFTFTDGLHHLRFFAGESLIERLWIKQYRAFDVSEVVAER